MDGGRHTAQGANVAAWASRSPNMVPVAEEEMGADVDEPPERGVSPVPSMFQKTTIRKPSEGNSSLLTKALLSQPEDEAVLDGRPVVLSGERRRSTTSNISQASTADLTSDTGLTSPSRANTPSPPLPDMRALCIHEPPSQGPKLRFGQLPIRPPDEPAECAPRKRGITFACFAKPEHKSPESESSHSQQQRPAAPADTNAEAPRRPCVKFACPAAPRSDAPGQGANARPNVTASRRPRSPPPMCRLSSTDSQGSPKNGASHPQNSTQRRVNDSAYDEPTEDDWIREDDMSPKRRITIGDTLVKENQIRRLGQEAEDEEEAEEDDADVTVDRNDECEDDEGDVEDDEDEDEDDDDDDDEDDEDGDEDETECGSFEADDGYHTDEETGFAESDEDEEDGLHVWNNSIQLTFKPPPGGQGLPRRPSATDHHSDSSTAPGQGADVMPRRKPRRIPNSDVASELPDSTDFVCGTFDEDRPMEEAYLSRRAALKARKMHVIPQDIDPSFPTSDIEDGDGEELFNPVHHESEDEMWRMDDVHGDLDRTCRKKARGISPKRYHSPAPKIRSRSPHGGFDRRSPRRMRSPCPKRPAMFGVSPPNGGHAKLTGLGVRGGFPQTKSLPRPGAMHTLVRNGKKAKASTSDQHVRGAIDIVKGLEQKRQRRREKYHQKYCDRARKGQIPERKAMPGTGATKMRELGLLMAGKTDRGNYVLSI
ncbi:hypothetical protein VUR80DRAFT_5404 [Thermomyces stellatus]